MVVPGSTRIRGTNTIRSLILHVRSSAPTSSTSTSVNSTRVVPSVMEQPDGLWNRCRRSPPLAGMVAEPCAPPRGECRENAMAGLERQGKSNTATRPHSDCRRVLASARSSRAAPASHSPRVARTQHHRAGPVPEPHRGHPRAAARRLRFAPSRPSSGRTDAVSPGRHARWQPCAPESS